MPKKQQEVAEPHQAPSTEAEALPPVSPPISFNEPEDDPAPAIAVSDTPPEGFGESLGITSREMEKLHDEARRENEKRDFHDKIMEARKPKPEPVYEAPTLPPRMAEQLSAELAAGREMVAKHAAQQAGRRPHTPVEETKAVFRPGDYVPNQRKGQGRVQAQTLR